MVSPADSRYLVADVTGAYRSGAEFVDTAETRELERQLAAAQNRRAEQDLAIRQAQEARRVRAAQLDEQQRRATMASRAQFGQDVSGILKQMREASQPGIVPPAQARPQAAPVAPSYSPLGMYGMSPDSTVLGAPPTTPLPQPPAAAPSTPVSPSAGAATPGAQTLVPSTVEYKTLGAEVRRPDTVTQTPLEETRTEAELLMSRIGQDLEMRRKLERIRTGLATGRYGPAAAPGAQAIARAYDFFVTGAGQAQRNRKARQEASDVLSWFQKQSTQKLFAARRDLLDEAEADPTAFYKKYKDVKPEDIPAAAPTAGVATAPATAPTPTPAPGSEALRFSSIEGITAAASPEVQAVAKRDAKAVQRLIEPTSGIVTTSDVIKAVINTKDPDKIRAPNILQYASDPPKASREVRQAELMMQLIAASVRHYGRMARFNPAAVAKTLDLVQRYQTAVAQRDALRGAQAIALFTSGDTRLAEQILSERQGVEVRFIPNPNNPGTFDRFENRQLIRAAIAPNVLLDALRRDLEVGYKESMIKTAATKQKYKQEMLVELLRSGTKIKEAELKAAGIKKMYADDRVTRVMITDKEGNIRYEEFATPEASKSTKASEALIPTRRTIAVTGGGVPTDPNKE